MLVMIVKSKKQFECVIEGIVIYKIQISLFQKRRKNKIQISLATINSVRQQFPVGAFYLMSWVYSISLRYHAMQFPLCCMKFLNLSHLLYLGCGTI